MKLIPYLASLVTINIVPNGGSIPGLGTCGSSTAYGEPLGGAYDSSSKDLYMCNHNFTNTITYNHELAHHVWFHLLTKDEINKYTTKWTRSMTVGPTIFGRAYSTNSVLEGFADDFMYLTGSIYEDGAIGIKNKFIRNQRLSIVRLIIRRLTRIANTK